VRVLHVITSGEHGGAQAHVAEVVSRLQAADVDCTVACGPGGWLAATLHGRAPVEEIPTLNRSISPWSDLRSLGRLVRLARRSDVVHTHSAKGGFLGRVAAFLAGRPFVHTSHGSFLAEPMSAVRRMILRAAERVVAERTAHLFVLSQADADVLRRAGLYAKVPSSLIRVPTERMRHPSGAWTTPAGPPVIITVANLYPNKAVDLLLSAFGDVRRQVAGASLIIVGDGPERERLVAQGAELDEGTIRFAGRVEDPTEMVLSARVFVLPSRKEGVPLALLEALALGVPSIATAVGGIPEHVNSDEAVLVAPDAAALARAIVDLLHHPDRAVELGSRGRRAAERYVTASSIDPLIAAYRGAVRTRTAGYTRSL